MLPSSVTLQFACLPLPASTLPCCQRWPKPDCAQEHQDLTLALRARWAQSIQGNGAVCSTFLEHPQLQGQLAGGPTQSFHQKRVWLQGSLCLALCHLLTGSPWLRLDLGCCLPQRGCGLPPRRHCLPARRRLLLGHWLRCCLPRSKEAPDAARLGCASAAGL